MTPKEKAQDLVNKFRLSAIFTDSYVKAIAKTAVDEIIFALSFHSDTELGEEYWVEVKQEIENL
jgi:gamma-glutamyl-gamma-aminobutyrate hydrolase PuuD